MSWNWFPRSRAREDAFERDVLVHAEAMHRFASRLSGDPAHADDLVQESLLKAYKAYGRVREGTNFKAWAFTIVRNTWISKLRKTGRERALDEPDRLVDDDAPAAWEHMARPEDGYRHGFEDEVLAALESLPEHQKSAIVLCDIEGMTYEQIATIMGCPVGTIRSRIHHGRRRLRDTLGAYARSKGYGQVDEARDNIRSHLSAYVDGELEPFETIAIRRHLGRCAPCQSDVAGLERLKVAVHVAGTTDELSRGEVARIERRFTQRRRPFWHGLLEPGRLGWVVAGAVATAAAVALFANPAGDVQRSAPLDELAAVDGATAALSAPTAALATSGAATAEASPSGATLAANGATLAANRGTVGANGVTVAASGAGGAWNVTLDSGLLYSFITAHRTGPMDPWMQRLGRMGALVAFESLPGNLVPGEHGGAMRLVSASQRRDVSLPSTSFVVLRSDVVSLSPEIQQALDDQEVYEEYVAGIRARVSVSGDRIFVLMSDAAVDGLGEPI